MILLENVNKVRSQIENCGRAVTIVAACKTQTRECVDELMKVAPDFVLGDNRADELLAKYTPAYNWHFIGQLQTNKVKQIIDKVQLIHSLDRLSLATEIERQASKHGKVQDCLVEVNMGEEETKGGVSPSETLDFVKSLSVFEHIRVCGLMSVLPKTDNKQELSSLYARLQDLYERTKSEFGENIKYLSAGMSHDYEIALAHGANMIRLGSLIFGERKRK